jgi:hypothetical protein
VRTGDPARHGLRSGPLAEARRTARALRALLGLESLEGPVGSRLALARTIVRALPWSAYVPHRRQGAFGNGRDEVVLARESRASRGAQALVVLERRSVRRRSRTVTLATCAGPVPLALLVEEGIGEERLVGARREGGDLVGVIERGLAGRVIDRREEIVRGNRAAQAAAMVVDTGRLDDDVEAWNLALELGLVQGERVDAGAWLVERLRELGVSCGADLDLLVPGDLALPGLDPALRATLDREHPRSLNVAGQVLRATYDVRGRRVTLEPVGGLRTPPSSRLLPPWPGWSVVFVDRGRSRRLR